MFGPFEIAATLLFIGGAVGVGWALSPWFRSQRLDVDPSLVDPAELAPDVEARLTSLLQSSIDEDDAERPFTRRLPMAEGLRVPEPFQPANALLAVLDADRAYLLPLDLLLAMVPGPDVQQGRTFGRPVHLVRLRDEVYLDLVSAGRILPLFAAELATLTEARSLVLFDDIEAVLATERVAVVVCPWVMEPEQPRTAPEGDGVQTFSFELEGRPLQIEAWMPAVRRGVEGGEPVAAARVTFDGHVEAGNLEADAREHLEGDETSFQWSRDELLQLAAAGQRLEESLYDLDLVQAAFADGVVPVPADEETALMVAAVLNWAGVVVRRHGMPRASLGYFDAGLSVVQDPDNRADLHYNRGYARLHAASTGLEPTEHERLHAFTFDEPDAALLDAALRDFTLASGLNPTDPDAWSQVAVVRQLQGDLAAASEAWLQAATRSHDEAVRQRMLANAEALRATE